MANLKLPGLASPLPATSTFGTPAPVAPSGETPVVPFRALVVVAETAISMAELAPRTTNLLLLYPTASTFVGGSIGYPL